METHKDNIDKAKIIEESKEKAEEMLSNEAKSYKQKQNQKKKNQKKKKKEQLKN